MQTNLHWIGVQQNSTENCTVWATEEGTEVRSIIVGRHDDEPFQVEYTLKTNVKWETLFFQVHIQQGQSLQHFLFERDRKGNWQSDGRSTEAFEGCIDVDLPLTPFTNSLPIQRLHLAIGKEQEIKVLYIDLLENEIKAVRQKYTRLSATQYHYANVPNDFEAIITVDPQGFVVNYPTLFKKVEQINTSLDVKDESCF